MTKLYKLIELNNNNYIYYYKTNNNNYTRYMLLQIYDFYQKYNTNDNIIQNIYIRNIKLNKYGLICINNNNYVNLNHYFKYYV